MDILTEWLPIIGLCMMRPLGVFLLLPALTTASLGGTLIRNTLILMIALPAVPAHLQHPAWLAAQGTGDYLWIILGEIAIGTMIGFVAAIPFWAIDMAGFVIDTLRGSSMSSIFNPSLGEQSSIFGLLFSHVLSTLFLVTGGFNRLIEAIYQSFVTFPPGSAFTFQSTFLPFCMQIWQTLFQLCLHFAMPAIVAMVLIDVAMGLINRSAKQLNVFFLSMPIKCLLALLLLAASLQFAFADYLSRITLFPEYVNDLLQTLHVQR